MVARQLALDETYYCDILSCIIVKIICIRSMKNTERFAWDLEKTS